MIDIAITRRTLEEFNLSKNELENFKQLITNVRKIVIYYGLCQGQNAININCDDCEFRHLCDLLTSYKLAAYMAAANREE